MAMVHVMFDDTVGSGSQNGTAVFPRAHKDEAGILQVEISSGSGTIQIQGRLAPDASFESILSPGLTASGYRTDIPIMPEMRVTVGGATDAVVKAWLME
ncbi:MAG: hypothetical protein QF404_08645 [Planctomycetota bacterium]|nr:hypothetical protein [Planctomycetota bacterium]